MSMLLLCNPEAENAEEGMYGCFVIIIFQLSYVIQGLQQYIK